MCNINEQVTHLILLIMYLIFLLCYCIVVVDFAADRRAKATQVSTINPYKASEAVDGQCPYYGERGFTHTEDDWYPWWQVDLRTFIDVRNVTVITRSKYNTYKYL